MIQLDIGGGPVVIGSFIDGIAWHVLVTPIMDRYPWIWIDDRFCIG